MSLKWMSNFLFLSLMVCFAYLLATVSLQLIAMLSPAPSNMLNGTTDKHPLIIKQAPSYSPQLAPYHLFGTPEKKAVSTKRNIPSPVKETKLNIKLLGVLNGESSVAVIKFRGKQRAYKEGDILIGSESLHHAVQLVSVEDNYIVISNNGIEEKITLPGKKQNNQLIISVSQPVSPVDSIILNNTDGSESYHGSPRPVAEHGS